MCVATFMQLSNSVKNHVRRLDEDLVAVLFSEGSSQSLAAVNQLTGTDVCLVISFVFY